jgi:hypothetical protein
MTGTAKTTTQAIRNLEVSFVQFFLIIFSSFVAPPCPLGLQLALI